MASWSTIKSMGGELCFIKTKKYMKDSGKTIKRKALECNNFQMDAFIRAIIKTENRKEKDSISGATVKLMTENGEKEKDTV